ncbi:MAG: hypothetical protein HAW67_06025 [Endozoicomonadaceae bacterium]|nr:hypothetical protein [Endozoicomonadaceae bacterium]
MISKLFIDDLIQNTSILDIMKGRVDLKKAGKSYVGLCPFHAEKTPSFYVDESKSACHCFGCGAGGGIIDFIQEYESLTFPDTIKLIADFQGKKVEYERSEYTQNTNVSKTKFLNILTSHFTKKNPDAEENNCNIGVFSLGKTLADKIKNNPDLFALATQMSILDKSTFLNGKTLPILNSKKNVVAIFLKKENHRAVIGSQVQLYNNLFIPKKVDFNTPALLINCPILAKKCEYKGFVNIYSTYTNDKLSPKDISQLSNHPFVTLIRKESEIRELYDEALSLFVSDNKVSGFKSLILPNNLRLDSLLLSSQTFIEKATKHSLHLLTFISEIITSESSHAPSNVDHAVKELSNIFEQSSKNAHNLVKIKILIKAISEKSIIPISEIDKAFEHALLGSQNAQKNQSETQP